jgi:RHS repeat-associated protein
LRVSQSGDNADPLVLSSIKAPKNGYAYIYLSNENDDAVYFDNFTVSDTRGRIIEENHYYAFGLKIAGISSVKMGDPNEGSLKNNNLYNDKELFDDADLDWYDYGFRNYDPQIGRFTQLDPLTDEFPELTNYQYASNDPIANIDIDGLEGGSAVANFTYNYTKTASNIFPVVTQTASNASKGLNIFKITARAVPTLANIAEVHSEQSTVNRQLQQEMQAQMSNGFPAAPTVSSCCNYFVSDFQKEMYAQKNSAEGYNPDGSLNFLGRAYQNKTWERFANKVGLPLMYGVTAEGLGWFEIEGAGYFLEGTGETAELMTARLQSYVYKAANQVDAEGDAAFTPKQLQAIQRNPNLRAMYRGNRIDVRARAMIKNDPELYHLQSNYTRGPDFMEPASGGWWDMTTPSAWPAHVKKYGSGGTLLNTQ